VLLRVFIFVGFLPTCINFTEVLGARMDTTLKDSSSVRIFGPLSEVKPLAFAVTLVVVTSCTLQ
jgi:hypothetical protein